MMRYLRPEKPVGYNFPCTNTYDSGLDRLLCNVSMVCRRWCFFKITIFCVFFLDIVVGRDTFIVWILTYTTAAK